MLSLCLHGRMFYKTIYTSYLFESIFCVVTLNTSGINILIQKIVLFLLHKKDRSPSVVDSVRLTGNQSERSILSRDRR